MTGTNAELIAWGKMLGGREQELADALEAAEAERDAALAVIAEAEAVARGPWPYSKETAERVGKLWDILSSTEATK